MRKLCSHLLLVVVVAGHSQRVAGQNKPEPPGADVQRDEQELPSACSPADIAKYGRPVMFRRNKGLAFGVSSAKNHIRKDEEASIYIWLSNESSADFTTYTCCEQTFLGYVRVLDSSGRYIPSQVELLERKAREEGKEPIQVCTCSGPLTPRPPGFCGVIDFGTLNRPDIYALRTGRYTVVEREHRASPPPGPPAGAPAHAGGLTIWIE